MGEINALHPLARQPDAAAPHRRDERLREIVGRAQAMAGLFMGALNDDEGSAFLRLGRAVERGEFGGRTLPGAAGAAGEGFADSDGLRAADWVGVLRSPTAFQTYRRSVQGPVTGSRVIRFLTCSSALPRSLAFCEGEAGVALARLPRSGPLVAAAGAPTAELRSGCLGRGGDGASPDLVAFARGGLLDLHQGIAATDFPPPPQPPASRRVARSRG